jgi:hypothetical protein
LISNFRRIVNAVCFLLHTHIPAYEDGTDSVFRNVGIQNSDAGELPRRKHTTRFVLLSASVGTIKEFSSLLVQTGELTVRVVDVGVLCL